MDLSNRLSISYYKTIATLNESHKIYLVQHQSSHRIFVKKIIDVYNINIYQNLLKAHIEGTPQIVEFFEDNNQLIVIEEYISGRSLEDMINNSSISIDNVYNYALELCDILAKLHSFNPPIIHRDIKPSNIIITEHNHVVLLDFNAAKHYNEASESDTRLIGTQGYAAPEQYGFGSSSPKTDIYAIGVLLKEMCSTLDFTPYKLVTIIEKCMQINPNDRYENISMLKNSLAYDNASIQTAPIGTNKMSFTLPGFRTKTPWKMLVAISNYLLLIFLCASLKVENTFGLELWIERIFCFFVFFSIILIHNNYLNIQNNFPLCNNKQKAVRYCGLVVLDTLFTIIWLSLLHIINIILF